LSTPFNLNLTTSVAARPRKSFPSALVDAVKTSLSIQEHELADYFTVSDTDSQWVAVRIDLSARETALCTMLLASLAIDGNAEAIRLAYNCTTLPPRGEKAIILLGFNVAFGVQGHAKKDMERVESLRGEKLTSWRNARTSVGTSVGTPATSTSTPATATEEAEGSVKL
jgi:hypothetical protein